MTEEGITGAVAEETAEEKEPSKRKPWLGWIIVSAVIVIGLIAYFVYVYRKKAKR